MTLLREDRELLDAFRDGDPRALERVYRHYVGAVAGFLRRGFVYKSSGAPASFSGVVSPFELENLVQEVFARALAPAARASYDGVRSYHGFLCGIARNIVLDQLRRRARRGETVEPPEAIERRAEGVFEETGGLRREPADTIDERRGRKLVEQFIADACDDRDRTLYELRVRQERSQQETADEAGLTRIQVRRWERKFRGRLLRFLKRAGYVR